jgi:hypothetical protein
MNGASVVHFAIFRNSDGGHVGAVDNMEFKIMCHMFHASFRGKITHIKRGQILPLILKMVMELL